MRGMRNNNKKGRPRDAAREYMGFGTDVHAGSPSGDRLVPLTEHSPSPRNALAGTRA